MYQYNIFVLTGQMVLSHWITTDVNLLEMYKSAKLSGSNEISWEKGLLDLTSIMGIFDITPEPAYPIDETKKEKSK